MNGEFKRSFNPKARGSMSAAPALSVMFPLCFLSGGACRCRTSIDFSTVRRLSDVFKNSLPGLAARLARGELVHQSAVSSRSEVFS